MVMHKSNKRRGLEKKRKRPTLPIMEGYNKKNYHLRIYKMLNYIIDIFNTFYRRK